MFKLNRDSAAAVLRLQVNPDFKTICGLLQDKQDETERNLREIDGANLFRCQGISQVLHAFLHLDEAAQQTLKPPTPPTPPGNSFVDINFGQRDNPHFVKR